MHIIQTGSLAQFLYSTTPAEPNKFGAAGRLGGCGEGEINSFLYVPSILTLSKKGGYTALHISY